MNESDPTNDPWSLEVTSINLLSSHFHHPETVTSRIVRSWYILRESEIEVVGMIWKFRWETSHYIIPSLEILGVLLWRSVIFFSFFSAMILWNGETSNIFLFATPCIGIHDSQNLTTAHIFGKLGGFCAQGFQSFTAESSCQRHTSLKLRAKATENKIGRNPQEGNFIVTQGAFAGV